MRIKITTQIEFGDKYLYFFLSGSDYINRTDFSRIHHAVNDNDEVDYKIKYTVGSQLEDQN